MNKAEFEISYLGRLVNGMNLILCRQFSAGDQIVDDLAQIAVNALIHLESKIESDEEHKVRIIVFDHIRRLIRLSAYLYI